MNIFLKQSTVQKIESAIADLKARRTSITKKLATAESNVGAALEARRDAIISAADDSAANISKFDSALANAERDRVSLVDAITELDRRIDDAQDRLITARDAEFREKASAQHEAAAEKIQEIATRLDRHIEALAGTFNELADAIPHAVARIYEPGGARDATPTEAARCVVSEGLYSACPELFEVVGANRVGLSVEIILPVRWQRANDGAHDAEIPKNDNRVNFLLASGAAERSIVLPLRATAAAIREGKASPTEPTPPPQVTRIIEPPPFPEKDVVLIKPIQWIDYDGQRTQRSEWPWSLPKPVADAALARGAAALPGSPDALAHIKIRLAAREVVPDFRNRNITDEDFLDLDINLQELREAERVRLAELREAAE